MPSLTFLPDSKDPTLLFAGSELTSHYDMLPVQLPPQYPVTLLVNPTLAENGRDAFVFCFSPAGGRITGSNGRSVLLGVYGYLRRIGFVFLHPGKDGAYVPSLTNREDLYCEETHCTAAYRHRGVCVEGADSVENVLDFIDWLPKNGFNSFFVQFKKPDIFFERWYDHTFNPTLPAEPQSRQQLDDMEAAVTRAMALRGILDHRVGHGWTAEAIGFSNTGWHAAEITLDAETEKLVAQVGGRRALWQGVPTNTNLCYANPEARRRLVEQVVTYAKEHPGIDYLHFWLADEYNNICECDACSKTTLSDQYVEILNAIDRRLTAEGLDTKIVFLLYQELLYAPLRAKLENSDRFCLMFAPISRTFERTYPRDIGDAAITPYVRNRVKLPETMEGNLAHYFSWKAQFSGDTFFYDYPLGRAHYGDFGYMKIAKVIYDDIHSLKALGSNGYMSCQELRAMTPTGFPNYVMGQSLLDDTVSYEEMKRTYFSAMFGSGYEAVIAYLEQLSALSDTDYFNGHGPRLAPELEPRFSRIAQTSTDFLLGMDDLHEDPPQHRKNWDFLKFHSRYCILLSRALAALCVADLPAADTRFREFCGFIRENELKFQPLLDVYRVIEVSTKYTGFHRC